MARPRRLAPLLVLAANPASDPALVARLVETFAAMLAAGEIQELFARAMAQSGE